MDNKTLKRRREIVKVMAESSLLSVSDIAEFFDVVEHSIRMDIQHLQLDIHSFPEEGNRILLDSLIQKRDSYINDCVRQGVNPEDFLSDLGLYALPAVERTFQSEEEKALFSGASVLDLADAQGITKTKMSKYLKSIGIENPAAVIKEGEKYRRAEKVAKLKILLTEGVGIKEAAKIVDAGEHVTNVTRQNLIKDGIIKESATPLAYKNADRREKIFGYYSEGFTQQEIADKMKMTRGTVNIDLKRYFKEHPEAKDKTILWRQRNSREAARMNRRSRKDDVLLLRDVGLSPSKIAKLTKIHENMVRKYLDEEGMLGTYIGQRRALVLDLVEQGLDDVVIANELGYSLAIIREDIFKLNKRRKEYGIRRAAPEIMQRRAEEMKLSWQGMPTTQIMNIVKKNRTTVLADQHISSNFLRNNPDALAYVTAKNGDVTKEAAGLVPVQEEYDIAT